jgi:hypothetical protein
MPRLLGAIALASVLTISLAGCLQLPAINTGNPPASDPSFAPQPTEEPPADTNSGFGDAVTYTDGVSISVSAPAEFAPTQYAYGADQAYNVLFNLTITNGSDANLEPSVYSRVSSGGVESTAIFDTDNNLNGGPTTVILPGGTITWSEGYSVADPASIIFQVAPSFDYDDSIFTNAG